MKNKNLSHLFKQTHKNKTTSATYPVNSKKDPMFNVIFKTFSLIRRNTMRGQHDTWNPANGHHPFLLLIYFWFRSAAQIPDSPASLPNRKISWLPKVWVRPESSWIFRFFWSWGKEITVIDDQTQSPTKCLVPKTTPGKGWIKSSSYIFQVINKKSVSEF